MPVDNFKPERHMKLEEFLHGGFYTPKGGMCIQCQSSGDDCSGLDFAAMPLIQKVEKQFIVKCTSYQQKENKGTA